MAQYGLFVGIDRYASPEISELRCAARDAKALYALFKDTIEGEYKLLKDEEATRSGIEKEFFKLAECREDDCVVIAFSGHGSETHELVTYDAETAGLEESAIPLDILLDWFSQIPARHIVCILDCCFSGGMGAKVLQVPLKARHISSTETILKKLSGEGRIILTASASEEEAFEIQKLGHGLLTYYLIEALKGAEEVVQGEKIPFYRLLDYVSQRVTQASSQLGKKQHPNVRGKVDKELMWSILKPGPVFNSFFPEYVRMPVASSLESLTNYGFPQEIINSWAGSIPGLNQLQIDSINKFELLEGEHIVVSAPTSSGKTMIGELAALKNVMEGKRSVFLLPLKALVNDKHNLFNKIYSSFGVRTIHATGDSADDIPALLRGQYDLCLMTYEKFSALVLAFPHILEQIGTVVIDEVQMIADKSRGINLEFILTFIRMRRKVGIEPQLIVLSAVIGETFGLEQWLGARLLRRNERPIPLDEGIVLADGTFRYIESENGKEKIQRNEILPIRRKGSSQDWIIPLVNKLVKEGKQVIVFRETKGEARGAANYLSESLGLPSAKLAIEALPTGDPSVISGVLKKCLIGGVAFHTSDLDRFERAVIEEKFREPGSKIRVIAATTTIAMGVNTPAEAVIIAGLEHPGPQPQPYSVAEYKNIIGRAGRLGFVDRGTSYLLALNPKDEYNFWHKYVKGEPESLDSRFFDESTDPRSLILRVLVSVGHSSGLPAQEIVDFLEGSFGAFQEARLNDKWKWNQSQMMNALGDLEKHKLVFRDEKGLFTLTKLGRIAGQVGVEVESVIRIVKIIESLDTSQITDPTLIAITQVTVELDEVLFPVNKKGAQKEFNTWKNELYYQSIPEYVIQKLEITARDVYQAALRAKKIVACLLWITDHPMSQIEKLLTKHGLSWNGAAGPVRSVSARTCDILETVARIAKVIKKDLDLEERLPRLLTRLDVGVPANIIDIALHAGNRLSRADYQSLMKNDLFEIEKIEKISDKILLGHLNNDEEKLKIIRTAIHKHLTESSIQDFEVPMLPPYEE